MAPGGNFEPSYLLPVNVRIVLVAVLERRGFGRRPTAGGHGAMVARGAHRSVTSLQSRVSHRVPKAAGPSLGSLGLQNVSNARPGSVRAGIPRRAAEITGGIAAAG